ncbi:MAG: hypothetical protein KAS32_05025 [Candidatus Peribacteraceae bacterium]|nr:hypothetical protein [Candidatus Peribacteraceae bacterium]
MPKVYIICTPTLLGSVWNVLKKKPDLSKHWPAGTTIYEAEVIGDYETMNMVKPEAEV